MFSKDILRFWYDNINIIKYWCSFYRFSILRGFVVRKRCTFFLIYNLKVRIKIFDID